MTCSNTEVNELRKVIFISILLFYSRGYLLGDFTMIVSNLEGYYH